MHGRIAPARRPRMRISFSSHDLSAVDRPAMLREVYARSLIGCELAPLDGHALDVEVDLLAMDGCGTGAGCYSALPAMRDESHTTGKGIILSASRARFGTRPGRHASRRTGAVTVMPPAPGPPLGLHRHAAGALGLGGACGAVGHRAAPGPGPAACADAGQAGAGPAVRLCRDGAPIPGSRASPACTCPNWRRRCCRAMSPAARAPAGGRAGCDPVRHAVKRGR